MCGILSICSFSQKISETKLSKGIESLYHRGPDNRNFWVSDSGKVGLGHARLSIIDFSTGNQPLSNSDNSLHLVVNGEFYDFERIRAELEKKGHYFKTKSDSEIALHLYAELGTGCLQHLRGEFAFTLWDESNKTLFAARDRFGINPLYYAEENGRIYVGSEIKSLLAAGVSAEWDEDSYLSRAFFYRDRSLFKNIKQVPPGHFLISTASGTRIIKYWDLDYSELDGYENLTSEEAISEVRNLLLDSVETRLRADVPVGVYLSGGIDSCAVLGLVSHLREKPIEAFTLSFDDNDYDEAQFATNMANHANAKHHLIPVDQRALADNFEDSIYFSETLCMNSHGVAKYMLSKAVNELGYRVVLTGEGADELFAGYPTFRNDLINTHENVELNLEELASENKVSASLLMAQDSSEGLEFIKRYLGFEPSWLPPLAKIFGHLKGLYNSETIGKIGNINPIQQFLNHQDFSQLTKIDPVHQSMYLMCKASLPNYVLMNLGDRMEMAHSLEGRVPFLDHKLAEKVTQLPIDMKIKGKLEKYILREAVRPFVLDEVLNRHKHPFLAPPSILKPEEKFHQLVQDTLRSDLLDRVPFFERTKVISLLDSLPKIEQNQWPIVEAQLMEMLSLCMLQKHFNLK